MNKEMNYSSGTQAIKFIIKIASPFKGAIFIMIIASFLWAVDLSLRPYLLKIVIDLIAAPDSTNLFANVLPSVTAYVVCLIALTTIYRFYDYFVMMNMVPKMRQIIVDHIFSYTLRHSHTYYQNSFAGGLANKINDLLNHCPDILHLIIDEFLRHSLALIIAIYALWQVNIKFALALLIWVVFFITFSLFWSRRLTSISDLRSEQSSTVTGKMVDAFSNILSIRLFARIKKERSILNQAMGEVAHSEIRLNRLYFYLWMMYGYSFVVMQCISFYFLIQGRMEGWVSVGDFALVLGINGHIIDCLWQIARDFSEFSKHLGKVIQGLRLIGAPLEITDKNNAKELKITNGIIKFDQVRFHYKGAEALFEDVSVEIKSGQKVGLVGYSGSGKSTFVNLILRLFDVNKGRILLDGHDIREVTQESLHRSISMIPQEPSLFHRTLLENLRYGRIEATDEEVIEAAKRAHAHDFIMQLPQGYQSMVGERGVKLSGGQRQRIAIARAIVKDAPILMLDEATSQLDSVTEALIQEILWQLMQNRTTIIIAHRLSTVLHMDRILVFNKGNIVQDGTHEELSAKEGLYRSLWAAQVGGFLPDKKE